jgi:hypothetical protein
LEVILQAPAKGEEDVGGWFRGDVAVELSVVCAYEQMNAVCAHVHLENAHFTYLRVLV